LAAIPDRGLGDLGESLQQPGQRDFDPDMILGHIEMTRRRLPERADAKDQAVLFPSLLIDLQHRHAGCSAGESY